MSACMSLRAVFTASFVCMYEPQSCFTASFVCMYVPQSCFTASFVCMYVPQSCFTASFICLYQLQSCFTASNINHFIHIRIIASATNGLQTVSLMLVIFPGFTRKSWNSRDRYISELSQQRHVWIHVDDNDPPDWLEHSTQPRLRSSEDPRGRPCHRKDVRSWRQHQVQILVGST